MSRLNKRDVKELRDQRDDNPKDLIEPWQPEFAVVKVEQWSDKIATWVETTYNNGTVKSERFPHPEFEDELELEDDEQAVDLKQDQQAVELVTVKQEKAVEISRNSDGTIGQAVEVDKIVFYKENKNTKVANIPGEPKKIEFRTIDTDLSLQEAAELSREVEGKAPSVKGHEIKFRFTDPVAKLLFRPDAKAIDHANKNAELLSEHGLKSLKDEISADNNNNGLNYDKISFRSPSSTSSTGKTATPANTPAAPKPSAA